MPAISRENAPDHVDYGMAEDHLVHVDDWTICFTDIKQDSDLGPILAAALPEGHCTCPHWGYVLSGTVTVAYPDRTEVLNEGDAFYMPPGHAPSATAGSRFVMFSPTVQLQATEAAIGAFLQQQAGGSQG
jgi:hypothetical protein